MNNKINFTIKTVLSKEEIEYSMTPFELIETYERQIETGQKLLPLSDDRVISCEFCGTKLHILRFGQLFDIFTKAIER